MTLFTPSILSAAVVLRSYPRALTWSRNNRSPPVSANPNVSMATADPIARNPNGVRSWRICVMAANPNPTSAHSNGPITGCPNVTRSGRHRHDLHLWWRRRLGRDHRCGWRVLRGNGIWSRSGSRGRCRRISGLRLINRRWLRGRDINGAGHTTGYKGDNSAR
jgi:hypothetical protein